MADENSPLLCLGVFLISGVAPASQWKEPAESENKMVWYTTIGSADAKMLVDEFRRRYPRIAAEYFRTGGPSIGRANVHRSSRGKTSLGCVHELGDLYPSSQ